MLLGGGLRQGQLTELVGPSSSGKTQVSRNSRFFVFVFFGWDEKNNISFTIFVLACS